MKFYPRVNVTDQDKMSLHLRWKKTKCLCRFLDSMTKSQSRISKKDSHKAEGKMPLPKQFQNRNWQAEVRMVCNGEHCLHWLTIKECLLWNPIRSSLCTGTSSPTWGCYRSDVLAWVKLQLLNDKSPNGVQRGTLLALAKIILLVDICAVIFRKYLSIPKSCLWSLLDGKKELKTWEIYQWNGMSVVESHTVISLVLHLVSGVLPGWCTGMGQTSTSNVTRHYQGATLWDKGKKKWVPLLISELVKYQFTD